MAVRVDPLSLSPIGAPGEHERALNNSAFCFSSPLNGREPHPPTRWRFDTGRARSPKPSGLGGRHRCERVHGKLVTLAFFFVHRHQLLHEGQRALELAACHGLECHGADPSIARAQITKQPLDDISLTKLTECYPRAPIEGTAKPPPPETTPKSR